MVTVIGRTRGLRSFSRSEEEQQPGRLSGSSDVMEIIDEGRETAVTHLTRLRQETTTGVDARFGVHTGPLMNTNSQLAEDEGAATEEQLEKYESVPRGKEKQ